MLVTYCIYALWIAGLIVTLPYVPFAAGIALAAAQTWIYNRESNKQDDIKNLAKVFVVLATLNQLGFMFIALLSGTIQLTLDRGFMYSNINLFFMCLWAPISGFLFYKSVPRLKLL